MCVSNLFQDFVDIKLASKLLLTLFKSPLSKHERTFPQTTAVSAATQDRSHESVVKQFHHRYFNFNKLISYIRLLKLIAFSTLVLPLLRIFSMIGLQFMLIFLSYKKGTGDAKQHKLSRKVPSDNDEDHLDCSFETSNVSQEVQKLS